MLFRSLLFWDTAKTTASHPVVIQLTQLQTGLMYILASSFCEVVWGVIQKNHLSHGLSFVGFFWALQVTGTPLDKF